MSKYEQLARQLMEKIRSGIYPANTRLPTTMQLCEEYGVSKITVKQAMDELEAHGLVSRRRGSGVFVKGLEPAVSPIGGAWSPASQMAGFTAASILLEVLLTMCTAYLAITLSATLLQNKKGFLKGLISIVLFVALSWGSSWLAQKLLYTRIEFGAEIDEFKRTLGLSLLLNFGLCALFAGVSAWLLDKKVDM
jgi:hypothetical protein